MSESFEPTAHGALQLSRVALASAKTEVASGEDLFLWPCAFVLIEHKINIHVTEGRLL